MEIKWEITSSNATKYHTTTQPNVETRGTLYTRHILSQESSPTKPTPTPTPPPPPCLLAGVTTLPVNKSFPAQVTFGMFNLREVQMCSAESKRRLFCLWVSRSSRRCNVFFSLRRERVCFRRKINPSSFHYYYYYCYYLPLWLMNTSLLRLQRFYKNIQNKIQYRLDNWTKQSVQTGGWRTVVSLNLLTELTSGALK